MDSAPRRRRRSTGPARSGAGPRAGRGLGSARSGRNADRSTPGDPVVETPGPKPPASSSDAGDDVSAAESPAAPKPAPARSGSLRTGSPRTGRGGTSRPAGTRPGTAPSAAATGSGRRIGRIVARGPSQPQVPRTKSQLAKQVAVLGLVFCAVALALAVPLRGYIAARASLSAALTKEQQMHAELAVLDQQKAALADPAYIRSEAKRRLQYVQPGDTVYEVHAPPLPPAKTAPPAAPEVLTPWYSSLWDTLSDPTATAPPTGKAAR